MKRNGSRSRVNSNRPIRQLKDDRAERRYDRDLTRRGEPEVKWLWEEEDDE